MVKCRDKWLSNRWVHWGQWLKNSGQNLVKQMPFDYNVQNLFCTCDIAVAVQTVVALWRSLFNHLLKESDTRKKHNVNFRKASVVSH